MPMDDKHITIADVARAANVSRTLVSFVLNGRKDVAPATRERILQVIDELGYRPNAVARNLATKRAGAIGIVCDIETYQDPLDMQFLAAMLTFVSEMGQRVILMPVDDRQIQDVAQDHAVDGIIFLDEVIADPRIAYLREMGIPALGLWGEHWDMALRKGLEDLALHLDSRGIQQAICLCGPEDQLFVTRFRQFIVETLRQYGIAVTIHHSLMSNENETMRTLTAELKKSSATVIVASSDKLAIDVLRSLHATHLRVPDDCAVTGFGDAPAAQWVQPPLTTIRVPVKAMALWAVSQIFQASHAEKQHTQTGTINCRLIVRRSC